MPLPVTGHQPAFTGEQLVEAKRVAAQRSASHWQVLRARLTLALAAEPTLSHAQVARRCGMDRDTVYKWRRRWARDGWSLEDAPRSGRPPAFSPSASGGGQGDRL